MNLAPIVFFVYNRPFHTIQSLKYLKLNKLYKKTDLIVFIDGPKNDIQDKIKVSLVQDIIHNIKGFKSKKIIFRKKNFGLSKNFISGISSVLKKYEKVIVLEDDNLVSRYFLDYVNSGLEIYKNDKNICAINGYSYPVNKKGISNYFFVKGADTWGWGTWRRAWDEIIWDPQKLLERIKNKNILKKKVDLLKNKINKKNDSYTIMYDLSMQLKNRYSLVPKISYSINSGFDGSGRHAKTKTNMYNSVLNQKKIPINKSKVIVSKLYQDRINLFYREKFKQNFINIKIKLIEFTKKILGKKLEKSIKKNFFNIDEFFFKKNKEAKFIDYFNLNNNYKNENYLIEFLKKNFLYTFHDGKIKSINESNYYILKKLKLLLNKNEKKLNIVEFGGGIGQKYLEFVKLFNEKEINWSIVEPKKKKNLLPNKKNYFFNFNEHTIKLPHNKTNILIISSYLQYLKDPYEFIRKICRLSKVDYLIIDNIPLTKEQEQRLLKRHDLDKKKYYSYFLFNQKKFVKSLSDKFKFKEKINLKKMENYKKNYSFKFYDLFLSK